MAVSQIAVPLPSPGSAWERLEKFLNERRSTRVPVADPESFERQLHALFTAAEAEALGEDLGKFDLDVPVVEIEGVAHRQVLRSTETYMTSAGPVRIERSLYSTRQEGERSVCPLELRAGIVAGFWTPLAARQATWMVAHLTPQEVEEALVRMGGMQPSRSILDRLPKQLSERWEKQREEFERRLRVEETVPDEAASVAVSLDGVMVAMKDGKRQEKRRRSAAAGKYQRGPAGHQEAGCATLTFYDEDGDRLRTLRLGRMPEPKKATLKHTLAEELKAVLSARPDLELVKLADGAKDNWTYLGEGLLGEGLRGGKELVDFFHAAEQLHAALAAAYGDTNSKCQAQFVKLRHVLRHEFEGAEKVIRALVYLRDQHPHSRKIATVLGYFRLNRHRMAYAELAFEGLPIGTGVTEAACKTLVTQRMKRSGMRWRHDGGQAILTLRALAQSQRFDRGWSLLAATYKSEVKLPAKVIAMPARRTSGVSV